MDAITQDAATVVAKDATPLAGFVGLEPSCVHGNATPATSSLPEHSPLGASSAERWMNCPGSVALISALSLPETEEPDYRTEGVAAHTFAAHCLDHDLDCWEAEPDLFPGRTAEMMQAVQTYLDFCRSLPGEHHVENRVHLPEFHPQFLGTLDFAAIPTEGEGLHFVDYKHGAGLVVEVDDNPQLKYYAYGKLAELPDYGAATPLKLTIVQPRVWHPKGTIRTWETTVGAIRQWARDELRPAMDRTADAEYLDMGAWCRFCPAKLVCPAMLALADKARRRVSEITFKQAQLLKMLVKAIEADAFARLSQGDAVEGAKLVHKRVDRVFKSDAPILAIFGDDAWKPSEMLSPAGLEKLPGGKEFVHEWAYKPEAGLTIAADDDLRAAATVRTSEEAFAGTVARLETVAI